MFLEFLEIKIRLHFLQLLNILGKLALVLLYPKTLLPTVQLMIFCYSYVKYYAILVILSVLSSEFNLCIKY